jgi:hypothetical protein
MRRLNMAALPDMRTGVFAEYGDVRNFRGVPNFIRLVSSLSYQILSLRGLAGCAAPVDMAPPWSNIWMTVANTGWSAIAADKTRLTRLKASLE